MMENFNFQSLGETGSIVVAFLFVAWKVADMWFKYAEKSENERNAMLERIGQSCHDHQKEQNELLHVATNRITTALEENTKVISRFRDTEIRNISILAAQEVARHLNETKNS